MDGPISSARGNASALASLDSGRLPAQRGPMTYYNRQLADEICSRVIEGQTIQEIGSSPGMPHWTTIWKWVARHPEFCEMWLIAKRAQMLREAESILEIADDGRNDWMQRRVDDGTFEPIVDKDNIQRSRVRIDARKWLLAKMMPSIFGERVAIEHSGSISRAAELSDDDLATIARGGSQGTDQAAEDPDEPD